MIYIFVHIPRTGGTSLRAAMDRAWGPCVRVGPEFAGRLGDAVVPGTKAYYGHHPFGLHKHLVPGEPYQYITLLRDPRERLASAARNAGCTVAELLERRPEQRDMMVRLLSGQAHAGLLSRDDLAAAIGNLLIYFKWELTSRLDSFQRALWLGPAARLNVGPPGGAAVLSPGASALDEALFRFARGL